MANLRAVLLFCCLLWLSGCRPPDIEVAVRDCSASNLTLQLTQGRHFYGLPKPAYVHAVSFYYERNKPLSPLWSVESLQASGNKLPLNQYLSTLTYGVPPAGFQGSPAKPLQPGRLVRVRLDGIDYRELDLTVCQSVQ